MVILMHVLVVELCGELFHTWFWESDLMLGINITLWKMMKSHMFPKWGESLTSNSTQVGEFSVLLKEPGPPLI